ncbi:hypothetical protein GGR50DRAFT_517823 [Xylaria sp. CBS 124048]|nr:hypothetical protein GGR50DRAFT_517823 [Xylaria sp. CBS 124048]
MIRMLDEDPHPDSVPLMERDAVVDNMLVPDEQRSKRDLLLLTAPFFSLQLAWSIQQVFGIPHLASLSIPDTLIPLLVISGPVAGILVPPIVAALSENIESPLGKRKPFIYAGGCGTILSFIFLGAAKPIAIGLSHAFGGSDSSEITVTATRAIAGLSIYALNFSIQPLALGLRASVVDYFGPLQQSDANLWIGRFSSLGSISMALFGLSYSPAFWVLCIAVIALIGIMLVAVAVVAATKDTDLPNREVPIKKRNGSRLTTRAHVVKILTRARRLPPITRWTCKVQLVSWVAWFFVLNYTSVLVSRMYGKPEVSRDGAGASTTAQVDHTKVVSGVALLFHSASLVGLVLVSAVWEGPSPSASLPVQEKGEGDIEEREILGSGSIPRERSRHADMDNESDNTTLAITERSVEANIFQRRNLLARRVWRPALLMLAGSIFGTTTLLTVAPQVSASVIIASILLGANGALFSLSNWVPYSLIAYEAATRARSRRTRRVYEEASVFGQQNSGGDYGFDKDGLGETGNMVGESDEETHTDDTPILLAVHQMAITIPQVVAGIASSLLMKVLEALGIQQGVWCIFALSVPAAVWAACL